MVYHILGNQGSEVEQVSVPFLPHQGICRKSVNTKQPSQVTWTPSNASSTSMFPRADSDVPWKSASDTNFRCV